MEVETFDVKGLYLFKPKVFGDSRGYFLESFSQQKFEELTGEKVNFVQDNESKSSYGVLRGLHFQRPPHAQAKLVRVIEGKVLDVAVDLRKASPTYGRKTCVELSGENKYQFFVPRGFAHGFVVLSETAIFAYKVDNYYAPQADSGIIYNDTELGIDWRVDLEKVNLSAKDLVNPTLKEYKENPIF